MTGSLTAWGDEWNALSADAQPRSSGSQPTLATVTGMITRQRLALASSALCTLTLLAACSGDNPDTASADVASLDEGSTPTTTDTGDGDGDAASPEDREEAMLDFAECMRDHGVDMADPQFGGDGEGGMIVLEENSADRGEVEEAQAACEPILEDAMGELQLDPEQEAEMREELLEFTECMRDHGIDMPDPVFGDDGRVTMEATPGERVGPGAEDEAFRAASEACGREGPAPVLGGGGGDESEDE